MTPQRTCIACRRRKEKPHLLRVARDANGQLGLWSGHGRSGYVCRDEACIGAIASKGKLEKALKSPISPKERDEIQRILLCELR